MAFPVVDSRLFCSRRSIYITVQGSTFSSDVNQLYAFEISGTVPSYNYKESGPSLKKKNKLLKTRHLRTLRTTCQIWQKYNNLAGLVLI